MAHLTGLAGGSVTPCNPTHNTRAPEHDLRIIFMGYAKAVNPYSRSLKRLIRSRIAEEDDMQILVHTDHNIEGSAELTSHVEALVEDTFARFRERLTRVEVYLADENSSQKAGEADKRCTMEARLGGLQPIAVTHDASTIDQALYGAADKLEKTIGRHLGRLDDHKGRTSFAGDQTL
jgi:ribosome-associated translation inhibitor RaiA